MHKYGIDTDFRRSDDAILELSDEGLKTVFRVFDEMIDQALARKTIPAEKFKIFEHYGIYMPDLFFKNMWKTCHTFQI